MRYEFYKLFIKRKAGLLILGFLVLRLITVFLQPNYAVDYKMEMYHDAYLQHMEELAGALNDEKTAYIKETNDEISALLDNDTAVADYQRGEITEAEFNERYRLRSEGSRMQDEFAVVNERYQSVLQNPERVYFLYSNGWVGLIGNENLDFVLLILVMLLIVPILCNEYTSDMYPILRTTPNGGGRLFAAKFLVGIATAVLCAVLFFAEEFVYFALQLGLPDGSFPLQSLPPFADSPYQISIFGAALLTLANCCLGLMLLTALLICLSALFKRALSAIFLGTVSVLLPFFLFSESVLKYRFPTPLGFLLSSGFLKGRYIVSQALNQYATITPQQYLATVCMSVGILVVLFVIGLLAFTGVWRPRKRTKAVLPVLLVMTMLFTGCTQEATAAPDFDGFVYDRWHYQPANAEFIITRDETNTALISYKNGDPPQPLIRDCFTDTSNFNLAALTYVDGDTIYYLNQYWGSHYEIMALDSHDFSVRSVHEVEWSSNIEEMDQLFGLGRYIPKPKQPDERVDGFFVHDEQLFLSKSGGIFRYDLRTDSELCIYDKQVYTFACADGAIYYTDEVLDVYRYDIAQQTTEKLPIGKIEIFYTTADGLYCKDLLDGNFYFVNFDGSKKELLPDFDPEQFEKGTDT